MEPKNAFKGEHYNLRWNNYTTNLIQVFTEHQSQETLVDVTLTCEGQYIKAHKLVLSACSDLFKEMFKMHGPIQYPLIILNGVKFDYLRYVMEFMYSGEIKVLDCDLQGVLALGENLQVKGLSSVKLKETVNLIGTINEQLKPPQQFTSLTTPNVSSVSSAKPKEKVGLNGKIKDDKITVPIWREVNPENKGKTDANKGDRFLEPPKKRVKCAVETSNQNPKMDKANVSEQIPRPSSAFMIFANQWRKKLAVEYPNDNNKEISVRLGNMWKTLSEETKSSYYNDAKKAQEVHQSKCPDNTYAPKSRKMEKIVKPITGQEDFDAITVLNSPTKENPTINDLGIQIIEISDDPLDITSP